MKRLDHNGFKLNYYFEMYKDRPFINRDKFKFRFMKENGKFQYIKELIVMVEKYQIKKYGQLIYDEYKIKPLFQCQLDASRDKQRRYSRRKYEIIK